MKNAVFEDFRLIKLITRLAILYRKTIASLSEYSLTKTLYIRYNYCAKGIVFV